MSILSPLAKSPWLYVIISILLIITVLFIWNPFFTWMANHLYIDEKLESSDVIIVLGGENEGERTARAVQLYEQGYADKLLLSDGTSLSWRTSAVEEMKAYALHLGIPAPAIHIENQSRSTYENAVYSRQYVEEQGWDSAIVVTVGWHSRRSRYIFEEVFEGSGIQLSYGLAKDPRFELDNWWKDMEKQQTVLTEWAKYVVYKVRY